MLKDKNAIALPGVDILQRIDTKLGSFLKAEINGELPKLKDVLKDYAVQIEYLLKANDDESLMRLEGILRHHSEKLKELDKSRFQLDLPAFHLDPVDCEKFETTQDDIGHRAEYYEDGTFVEGCLLYISKGGRPCSAQELLDIHEKFQAAAIEQIKQLFVENAKLKYHQAFLETPEERTVRFELELGYSLEEHHARMQDLDEYLDNQRNN